MVQFLGPSILQALEGNDGLTKLRKRYRLNGSELLVLKSLVKFTQQGNCYPKQETLVVDTGLADSTLRRTLNRMVEKRLIGRTMPDYVNRLGLICKGKLHHYHFAADVDMAIVSGELLSEFEDGKYDNWRSDDEVFEKASSIS